MSTKTIVNLFLIGAIAGALASNIVWWSHHTYHIRQIAALSPSDVQDVQTVTESPTTPPRPAQSPDRALYDAIRYVESGGWNVELGPVGEAGERGVYQITYEYWLDGTENTSWATRSAYNERVTDPDACEYVMSCVWRRYGATTDEQKARLHHRGPNHARQYDAAGDDYWRKIAALIGD